MTAVGAPVNSESAKGPLPAAQRPGGVGSPPLTATSKGPRRGVGDLTKPRHEPAGCFRSLPTIVTLVRSGINSGQYFLRSNKLPAREVFQHERSQQREPSYTE